MNKENNKTCNAFLSLYRENKKKYSIFFQSPTLWRDKLPLTYNKNSLHTTLFHNRLIKLNKKNRKNLMFLLRKFSF